MDDRLNRFCRFSKLAEDIAFKFNLHNLTPVSNLSYNYVLSGFQGDHPIILKFGLDPEALKNEASALQCFLDFGAVKIIAEGDGFLLLERVIPGVSLKSYFSEKDNDAIDITCKVMTKLHQGKFPEHHNFLHIKDWLSALDKAQDIPDDCLKKARILRDHLLATSAPDVLLHGDLHHDNILCNGDDWVVIDPKGVIGEPAYEIGAFIRNPMPQLLTHADAPNIIHNRINIFAQNLQISPERIRDWCFVQAVLAWVWAIEDGCEQNLFLKLAEKIYPHIF